MRPPTMHHVHVISILLFLTASVSAHPLGRIYGTHLEVLDSQPGIETGNSGPGITLLEIREDQHPMEVPSVAPEDIIHRQGFGVYPCSGKPLHVTAKNCTSITKGLHTDEYGFIPDGGFKYCMKPRSVKPLHVNGTCYSKPTRDEKKSEYLDEDEKFKVDDDLIARDSI